MTARDVVLARIRSALGSQTTAADLPRGYRRTGSLAPGSADLLDLFATRLVDYRAAVHATTAEALVDTIVTVLVGIGRIVVPPGLPTDWAPTATIDNGLSAAELDRHDTVLTGCAAAAAQTGTIVLDGGPGQGRRAISLVPDRHVCVVRADQVVRTVPELLARLDPRRPLTFISGPSATSDIELQRIEGVHGPRTLIVILVAP
jgi:L-lactate dehydrogenase complex protein LldG